MFELCIAFSWVLLLLRFEESDARLRTSLSVLVSYILA